MVTRRQLLTLPLAMAALPRALRAAPQGTASKMSFGYAAITWGANLTQAMDDIAAVGFKAIQLRIEAFQQFGDKPAALKEELQKRGLTFAVLSSGNLSIDPAREETDIAAHVAHAKFAKAAGCEYLQIIDERPKGRTLGADDYKRVGKLLSTIGQRTAEIGVPVVYHHHLNSVGERPAEVDAVLDAAEPRYVKMLFDVAHFQQAGGDPVSAIRKYASRIKVVHLKDVKTTNGNASPTGGGSPGNYQFVELGNGRVDLAGVFTALAAIKYDSWAIVELDRVPDPERTPKDCAEINKRFIADRGFRIAD